MKRNTGLKLVEKLISFVDHVYRVCLRSIRYRGFEIPMVYVIIGTVFPFIIISPKQTARFMQRLFCNIDKEFSGNIVKFFYRFNQIKAIKIGRKFIKGTYDFHCRLLV